VPTAHLTPDRDRPNAQTVPQLPPATDGALVAALDRDRRPVFSPSFASNGSAMFFHTGGTRDARSALARSDVDPSTGDLEVMTIVDDGARNYHVQPSPDGRMIAFDSDRDGERGVYIANRDGSQVRRLSGPGYAAVPTWSPDGRRVAYVRAEPSNPKVWNLWLQTLEDGRVVRLTNYRYGQPWSASWFPDNRRVCYTHEDRIVVLDTETGQAKEFASPIRGRIVRTPAVSPDGTKVVFQVFRQGVWLLDLAQESMRCILADPTAEEFAWAPDGRRLAFHSRRDGQWGIYILTSS
jgi:TolB protein